MPNDNLSAPAGPVDVPTSAPTEDSLIEDISNLLDDPSTDPVEEPEEAAAAPAEEDDPLGLGAEDEERVEAEEPDGSEDAEIKGGRYAPDSAKVKLEDGSTITILDLKRNNLYHAGFTQKTQALSEERKSFEAERQQVAEYAQSLEQSREYTAWYAEQFIPKQPSATFNGDATNDPQAFIAWQQDVSRWQAHVQAWQQYQQAKQEEGQRLAGETQKQAKERRNAEAAKLLEAIPVLKDPVKGKQVWDNIVSGASQHYGIAPEEVNSTADHRFIKVLRDALAYRRIKAAAPTVQAEVTKRPAVNNGRRAAPNAAQTREKQARTERLRSSGSIEDAAAAIADLL